MWCRRRGSLSEAVAMADTHSQHPLSYALLAKAAEKAAGWMWLPMRWKARWPSGMTNPHGILGLPGCISSADNPRKRWDTLRIQPDDPDNAEVMAALGRLISI